MPLIRRYFPNAEAPLGYILTYNEPEVIQKDRVTGIKEAMEVLIFDDRRGGHLYWNTEGNVIAVAVFFDVNALVAEELSFA